MSHLSLAICCVSECSFTDSDLSVSPALTNSTTLAAVSKDETWMKLIHETLDSDCFLQRGQSQRTAIHFAAQNTVSNSALTFIIKKCRPETLTVVDEFGDTPVHLAAEWQGSDSMQLMKTHLGLDCFHQRGRYQRTAIHNAAMNTVSNSAFKWLVKECGTDSLTVTDEDGNTPVHLAAWKQTADSLQFVADLIGTQVFFLKGGNDWTVTHLAAKNSRSNSALFWCITNLGPNCLLDKDSRGRTPIHLAAQHQDLDSLSLVQDSLGNSNSAFALKDSEGKTVADYAKKNAEHGAWMLEWLKEQEFQESLDQNFSSWSFLYNDKTEIGSGGFGKVYKAITDKQQIVAVKVVGLLRTGNAAELAKAVELEKKGVEILQRLRHPNIVQFLKTETSTEHGFCIFTELISGDSLLSRMQKQKKAFEESEVKQFSLQICSALHFLHCEQQPPIVHRDIKCDNIMLTQMGLIKLIDFGLAKEIVSAATGYSAYTVGTVYFPAVELFKAMERGKLKYTPKTDVWAFGCTVYEMLAMQSPNEDFLPDQIPFRVTNYDMPQLPAVPKGSDRGLRVSNSLRDFHQRCIAKNPGRRADIKELLRHRFLQDQDSNPGIVGRSCFLSLLSGKISFLRS